MFCPWLKGHLKVLIHAISLSMSLYNLQFFYYSFDYDYLRAVLSRLTNIKEFQYSLHPG